MDATQDDSDRLAEGGNFPPGPIFEDDPLVGLSSTRLVDAAALQHLQPLLAKDHDDLIIGRDHLLGVAARWWAKHPKGVTSEAEDGEATDIAEEIRKFIQNESEVRRVAIKGPVDVAADGIQAFFVGGIKGQLTVVVAALKAAKTKYLLDVDQRKREEMLAAAKARNAAADAMASVGLEDDAIAAEQEARQLAREAETARALDLTRGHSSLGVPTGLKETWEWETENLMDTVQAVAAGRLSIEWLAINEKYANFKIKPKDGERKVPGLRIYPNRKAK